VSKSAGAVNFDDEDPLRGPFTSGFGELSTAVGVGDLLACVDGEGGASGSVEACRLSCE
jgi:hypothetical protein